MINPEDMTAEWQDGYEYGVKQGKSDMECEYTSKVFERLREIDDDYISIDHLIEVLEWAKEPLKEQND